MKTVFVYTMDGCPHCVNFKNMLTECGVPFEERNIDTYDKEYQDFVSVTDNEYLPAFTLIDVTDKSNPMVDLFAPDDHFEDLNEATQIVKKFILE